MVGQGVLRECLADPEVERVLTVVRRATGQRHEKLEGAPKAVLESRDIIALAAEARALR